MKSKEKTNTSAIVGTALRSKEPVKELMEIAARLIANNDFEALHDIDVMLSESYLNYIRGGSIEDLKNFQKHILPFIDSDTGDGLRDSKEGNRYYHRWDHFQDLCEMAVENYDHALVRRFVESRKQGKDLLYLLHENRDGIRHNELARQLGIKRSQLSRLLNTFQEQDLITRERSANHTIIRLGLRGITYVLDSPPPGKTESREKELEFVDNTYKITTGERSVVAGCKPPYGNKVKETIIPRQFFSVEKSVKKAA